jgi:small conductance mechanosensitive channel
MTGNNHYVYQLVRTWGFTDFQARTTEFVLERPLRILLIVAIAWVVARLGSHGMARFVRSVHRRSPLRTESSRSALRTETMAGVLARLVRLVTAVVAGLMILGVVGIDLAPLIAGAGVAGVALAFGAQSLVRDMLAGLFIIGEDQYGVGDTIDLGQASGVVEDINLRSTRLRAADGTVWYVPNGQIQRVGNASMEFTKAVVDLPMPYGVELASVERIAGEEAAAMVAEPTWAAQVLDPPDVWGVQSLTVDGPIVRVVVKTTPAAQGPVGRELRRRITDRLLHDGVRPPAQPAAAPPA